MRYSYAVKCPECLKVGVERLLQQDMDLNKVICADADGTPEHQYDALPEEPQPEVTQASLEPPPGSPSAADLDAVAAEQPVESVTVEDESITEIEQPERVAVGRIKAQTARRGDFIEVIPLENTPPDVPEVQESDSRPAAASDVHGGADPGVAMGVNVGLGQTEGPVHVPIADQAIPDEPPTVVSFPDGTFFSLSAAGERLSNGDVRLSVCATLPESYAVDFAAEAEIQGITLREYVTKKVNEALAYGWLR